MKKLTTILFFAMVASQLGNTDCGQVLRDPGFDLWCGDQLCAWKLERGDIKRIPTWNNGDPGVELVGSDVAIEQLSPVDSGDGYCEHQSDGKTQCTYPANVCIEFSLLANIEANTAVDLNIDVFGDGTVDYNERLPTGKWQSLSYRIIVKEPFAGIRFELAKAGTGVAQLANIGAQTASDCEGLPIITPSPAPLGSPCADNTECASGICQASPLPKPFNGSVNALIGDTMCVACDLQHACTGGLTCGVKAPVSPIRAAEQACVAQSSKQLGEQCLSNNECDTNICLFNVCSTCTPNAGCATGETCARGWTTTTGEGQVYECNPHAGVRTSGQPCANDDDCASGVCNGTERKQCNDGRACIDASQCPFESGLKNGPCNTVGIQGGTCQ